MRQLENIADYLRAHAQELGDRIFQSHPPLHAVDDPPSPQISKLLRKPQFGHDIVSNLPCMRKFCEAIMPLEFSINP